MSYQVSAATHLTRINVEDYWHISEVTRVRLMQTTMLYCWTVSSRVTCQPHVDANRRQPAYKSADWRYVGCVKNPS